MQEQFFTGILPPMVFRGSLSFLKQLATNQKSANKGGAGSTTAAERRREPLKIKVFRVNKEKKIELFFKSRHLLSVLIF